MFNTPYRNHAFVGNFQIIGTMEWGCLILGVWVYNGLHLHNLCDAPHLVFVDYGLKWVFLVCVKRTSFNVTCPMTGRFKRGDTKMD